MDDRSESTLLCSRGVSAWTRGSYGSARWSAGACALNEVGLEGSGGRPRPHHRSVDSFRTRSPRSHRSRAPNGRPRGGRTDRPRGSSWTPEVRLGGAPRRLDASFVRDRKEVFALEQGIEAKGRWRVLVDEEPARAALYHVQDRPAPSRPVTKSDEIADREIRHGKASNVSEALQQ